MTSNSVVPSKACPKLNPSPEISGGMTSAGRNAKKPHCCFRSSTRPSAKQGDSSAMKSRISCAFTVSFGKNRQMLRTSLPRCVIALGWSLHSCPAMPLLQTVHTCRAGIGQLARGTFHGVGQHCVCPSSNRISVHAVILGYRGKDIHCWLRNEARRPLTDVSAEIRREQRRQMADYTDLPGSRLR